jgi:serine/threonine-protein kinase
MGRWWRRLSTAAAILIAAAPPSAAQRTDSYGAIAYGPKTSAWGNAYGETSAEDANKKALSFCARRAADCEVVASFSNTCAAVAVSQATSETFVATNEKRGSAESQALRACTQRNSSGCRVAASICAQR